MSGTKQEEIIYDANGNAIYTYTPGSTAPTNGSAMDYATWLQGHTKYQAEQYSLRQQKAIEDQRQKSIIDANNAYKTGLASYGANAERKASMGLSESGYSEYLTGKAYATQRADINAANSLATQRKDEVLYQEGQTKLAADAKYAEDLIGIQNQQNTDYTSIYDAAINGASIESIIQDGRWSTLTPEQQTTIRQVTTANSLMSRINAGESLESIKSGAEWNTLTLDQQTRLESLYNTKTETDTTAIESNYSTWLNAISTGEATLEQVKALSGYEKLTSEMKAALEKAESDYNTNKFNEENEANLAEFESNFATWLTNIKRGDITLDELRNFDAYKKMAADPNGAKFITQLEAAQSDYNTAYNAKAKEELDITAGLTDDDIKLWADKYNIDEATVNEVKTDRNKAVNSTISTNIDNMMALTNPDEKEAAMDTILAGIDEALEKGYISLIDVQGYYRSILGDYINNLGQVSIEDAISAEKDYKALEQMNKITYKDYNNFKKAVYEKAGKAVANDGTRQKVNSNSTDVIYEYKVNGTTYDVYVDTTEKASPQTSKFVQELLGRQVKNGSAVVVGDTVYVYVLDSRYSGWYQAKRRVGMGAFVNAIS